MPKKLAKVSVTSHQKFLQDPISVEVETKACLWLSHAADYCSLCVRVSHLEPGTDASTLGTTRLRDGDAGL